MLVVRFKDVPGGSSMCVSRTMKPLLPVLAAVSIAIAVAAPVAGQQEVAEEPRDPKADPRFQETVDVEAELPALPPSSTAAARLPLAVQDLPMSVSVAPRRLLDEQAAFVLGDALRNASGVNVGTGFGVFDFFVIRGFDSLSSGLVLTDGVPEPESTFYPLYNVRQVEVLKGPAAFLYGGAPLSGAVQLVRKQPQAKRFADVALSYGRFQTYEAAIDANSATADGRLAFRINGAYQGSDGYRDLAGGSIKAVNPGLVWRPDDDTRLAANFEYVRSAWPPDSGIPYVGDGLAPVPRTSSYQSPFDASKQDVYRARFEAERKLGETLTFRNRLYYTRLSWDSDGTLLNGVFPGPGGRQFVARTLVLLDDRQRLLGDQLELYASFRTGTIGHELLAGVEFSELKDTFTQDVGLLPLEDLFAPVETAHGPVTTIPQFGLTGDSRSRVVAPYVVDRLSLTKKLQAFVGARLDVLDYEDPRNATTRDSTRCNPMLGFVFSPNRQLALYASGGTSFAPPSTQVVGPREPETSVQLEMGGKATFLEGRAFAGLSLYHLDRNDVAIPDANGITRQNGDQRSRGVELDVSAEPARGWFTYATYAFTDAKLTRFAELLSLGARDFDVIDRSGNRAAFAPRHLASFWTSKHFASVLGLALGLRGLSEQFIAEDNRARIGGYVTLDAAVSYQWGRSRFSVNFKNLTGTEYETRGFGSVSAAPARPFEVLGRLELGFGAR